MTTMLPIFADTDIDPYAIEFAQHRKERERKLRTLIAFLNGDDTGWIKGADLDAANLIFAMSDDDIANVVEDMGADKVAGLIKAMAVQLWLRKHS